jgi:hypothetical protein
MRQEAVKRLHYLSKRCHVLKVARPFAQLLG